jgi:hypothetical protein
LNFYLISIHREYSNAIYQDSQRKTIIEEESNLEEEERNGQNKFSSRKKFKPDPEQTDACDGGGNDDDEDDVEMKSSSLTFYQMPPCRRLTLILRNMCRLRTCQMGPMLCVQSYDGLYRPTLVPQAFV